MQKLLEAAAKVARLDTEARADLVRYLREEAKENRTLGRVPGEPRAERLYATMAVAEDAIADLVEAAVASVAEVTLSGPGARAALPRLLAHDPELVAVLEEPRGVAGDRCESGSHCGRTGCPECQQ